MQAHAYEYVCAIAEHKNLSRAAQALYITQPALTKYINRLEKDLGFRLFDRSSTPISLTHQGEIFVRKSRQILELENELKLELHQHTLIPHGRVTLGLNGEFSSITLPYIYNTLKTQYPQIELKLTEGNNSFLLNELDKERIDLAVMSLESVPITLTEEPLQEEPILLAVPADTPLIQSIDLSYNSPIHPLYIKPELLKKENFIVCSSDTGIGKLTRRIFDDYDFHPHVVMELKKNEAVLRMASMGIGLAFIPLRTALRISPIKPLAYFSIANPLMTRKRSIYYPSNRPLNPSTMLLKQLFSKLFIEEEALRVPVCQLICQNITLQ